MWVELIVSVANWCHTLAVRGQQVVAAGSTSPLCSKSDSFKISLGSTALFSVDKRKKKVGGGWRWGARDFLRDHIITRTRRMDGFFRHPRRLSIGALSWINTCKLQSHGAIKHKLGGREAFISNKRRNLIKARPRSHRCMSYTDNYVEISSKQPFPSPNKHNRGNMADDSWSQHLNIAIA
jgi:hypothetical protein